MPFKAQSIMHILLGVLLISSVIGKITIDPKTRTFRDESGRARIFHGTNVVVKGPPYIPVQDRFDAQMSLNDEDIQNMLDWGITLVRLGVQWESVEVAEQVYNYTYLEEINKLTTKLGQRGIWVMIDAHQDLFSRKTCGNGMPIFYDNQLETKCPSNTAGYVFSMMGACQSMDSYGHRKDENGLPLIEDCLKNMFTKYYTSIEVSSAFEGLYHNQTIQQRFIDFWNVTSKYLANNEYVIGYDPINEPWPANLYKDMALFYKQTKFDSEILFPLLVKVHDVIRSNVKDMHYFYEPAQFPDTMPFFGGITAPLAFPGLPGGDNYQANQVLNDHVYCCQMSQDVCLGGEPPVSEKDKCKKFHEYKIGIRANDAIRYGVPLIWSEFGACSNTESCFWEITNAAEEMDKHFHSWAYWMFKGYGDFTTTGGLVEGMYDGQGHLQQYKVLALQRTFIHAFQGTPKGMRFINYGILNGTFAAEFTLDINIQKPTELYMNKDLYYKNGFKLSVFFKHQPIQVKTDESQKNYIKFKIDHKDAHQTDVQVVLTPTVKQDKAEKALNKDFKLKVQLESRGEMAGNNFFHVNFKGFESTEYLYELIGAHENILCSGKVANIVCVETIYGSFFAKFRVYTKGWFGNTYVVDETIPYINGANVNIELTKVSTKSEL